MSEASLRSDAARPLHARLLPMAAGLLVAVLVTDLVYLKTLLVQWTNFSIWLLTAGLVLAALSALVLLLDLALHRLPRLSWWRFWALTAAALLSLANAFVHSRDAYTTVSGAGVVLSAIVAVILVIVGLRGWNLAD